MIESYVHYEDRKGFRAVSLKVSLPGKKKCTALIRAIAKVAEARGVLECPVELLDLFQIEDMEFIEQSRSIYEIVESLKHVHFLVRMTPRVGLVCQLRNAGPRIASFIKYHITIGFERIYLYFDDGSEIEDADTARLHGGNKVSIRFRDQTLFNEWKLLRGYNKLAPFIHTDVQVRQMLNASHAFSIAQTIDSLDWLLHIDSDELFYPGKSIASIRPHFAKLHARRNCAVFTYFNFEAVPEYYTEHTNFFADEMKEDPPVEFMKESRHKDQRVLQFFDQQRNNDPFSSISLFKRPLPLCLSSSINSIVATTSNSEIEYTRTHDDRATQSSDIAVVTAINFWRQRSPNGNFFLFYQNGKSAVRCSIDAVPASVHLWTPLQKHGAHTLSWTNDPRHKGVHYDFLVPCAVLHFACADPYALWHKYHTLGNFPNACVANTITHETNTFHCLCRDTLLSASSSASTSESHLHHDRKQGRSAMYRLFLKHVALCDSRIAQEHINAGVLERVVLISF